MIAKVSHPACAYKTLLQAIGEGPHDLYGSDWEMAEASTIELWPSYALSTGLSWVDVRTQIRSAWERSCSNPEA